MHTHACPRLRTPGRLAGGAAAPGPRLWAGAGAVVAAAAPGRTPLAPGPRRAPPGPRQGPLTTRRPPPSLCTTSLKGKGLTSCFAARGIKLSTACENVLGVIHTDDGHLPWEVVSLDSELADLLVGQSTQRPPRQFTPGFVPRDKCLG